jgi:DNA repair protein RadD
MQIELRKYQQDAINALLQYFEHNSGSPLLSIPTGGGKSLVLAGFIREALVAWPSERFLVLSHFTIFSLVDFLLDGI